MFKMWRIAAKATTWKWPLRSFWVAFAGAVLSKNSDIKNHYRFQIYGVRYFQEIIWFGWLHFHHGWRCHNPKLSLCYSNGCSKSMRGELKWHNGQPIQGIFCYSREKLWGRARSDWIWHNENGGKRIKYEELVMTGEWKAPSLNNIVYKHLQINWQNYLIKVDT